MRQANITKIKDATKNIIFPVYSDVGVCQGLVKHMEFDLNKIVKVKFKEVQEVYTLGKMNFDKILFIGMGDSKKMTSARMREVFKAITPAIKEESIFVAHHAGCETIDVKQATRLFVESFLTSSYEERKAGHETKKHIPVEIFAKEDVQEDIEIAESIALAINHARVWQDAPANKMVSTTFLEEAKMVAKRYKMEFQKLDNDKLEEMGAGAILGVNQGSGYPAYIITLHYKNGNGPLIALVGKGLMFDSGGYNIKSNSLGMKYDMCGAADVLATLELLASTKAQANVLGVLCVTDNMVNEQAIKPGDVITSLSGKTIEVTNTDAEGRLALCDGITYAQLQGAKYVVDIATLTGACIRALGHSYCGIFSNDDAFYQKCELALKLADEKGWRLPLDEDYIKMLESTSADLKNCASEPIAGASVAANFLQEFVDEETKWIHLDIAGVSDIKGKSTGAMIRTMAELAKIV
ncbi:MAG: leucyl aminopeptidase family protein [Firmicutes bacterium]|nr:leucyl aminopeptidase family protein [Bacillota bacterium]